MRQSPSSSHRSPNAAPNFKQPRGRVVSRYDLEGIHPENVVGAFGCASAFCSGLIRLSLFGRQNPLDCFFRSHSRLIEQSDDILNPVASLAGLTKEQPHPSCLFSQLVAVHLLEREFLGLPRRTWRQAYTD